MRVACPECSKLVSEKAEACPKCGYKIAPGEMEELLAEEAKAKGGCKKIAIVVGIVVVALIVFGAIMSSLDTSPSEYTAQEIVANSPIDGSVPQVESWLKENLKDPASLEIIEWYKVQKKQRQVAGGTSYLTVGYSVLVKYRANNSFGGYVVERKLFTFDEQGRIESVVDK